MIKPRVFEIIVDGVRIIIEPKAGAKLDILPGGSTYTYKTATGDRWSEFRFLNSKPEVVRAIGRAFIEAADFVEGKE